MPEPAPAGLIAVVGGECTGKSTLAAALGERLPADLVPEHLRTWVDRHGRVPLAAEQAAVMAAHRRSELSALQQTRLRWVVSDSGPLMTAVYSIQYYGDDSLLARAVQWTARSGCVVWCQDDVAWQPDPQRDGSAARATSQRILASVFAEHPQLPVLAVAGPLDARIAAVLDTVRLPSTP